MYEVYNRVHAAQNELLYSQTDPKYKRTIKKIKKIKKWKATIFEIILNECKRPITDVFPSNLVFSNNFDCTACLSCIWPRF